MEVFNDLDWLYSPCTVGSGANETTHNMLKANHFGSKCGLQQRRSAHTEQQYILFACNVLPFKVLRLIGQWGHVF